MKKDDRHTLEIWSIKFSLLSKTKPRFLTEFVGEIICPSTFTGGKMEVTREKLIREVLDIFNIRLFCKIKYLKCLNNSTKNNYHKEEHVKEVQYKFVNHPRKDDN